MIEDKCLKCGKCCYFTYRTKQKKLVRTGLKCEHLTSENLCDTYDNRPKWCKSAEFMIKHNALPEGCGYIGGQ